jgi:hypothetical protein
MRVTVSGTQTYAMGLGPWNTDPDCWMPPDDSCAFNPSIFEVFPDGVDCNLNGVEDAVELAAGMSPDCNDNAIPDECDVGENGESEDLNGNGVPDECEPPEPTEACCLPDNSCLDVPRQECIDLGGSPTDPGTDCSLGECPLCNSSTDCDDANPCTVDTCDPDRSCSNEADYDATTECCDPSTGDLDPLVDDDPCTQDLCDPETGVVHRPPAPAGTWCDDGVPCTVFDACDGFGQCIGGPVSSVGCTNPMDCPPMSTCDVTTGQCVCVAVGCCLPDGSCEMLHPEACPAAGGTVVSSCQGDLNGNGVDDACEEAIPTVSEWGLLALALLLLAGITIKFGRRRIVQA